MRPCTTSSNRLPPDDIQPLRSALPARDATRPNRALRPRAESQNPRPHTNPLPWEPAQPPRHETGAPHHQHRRPRRQARQNKKWPWPRVLSDPSERVENALEFLRNWASFHFPKALAALDRIQEEIFGGLGMNVGSYSAFAVRLENQMLPSGLAALDEYGLPVQVALRVEKYLPVDGGIDEVLDGLKTLAVEELELESFEKELLQEVVESL